MSNNKSNSNKKSGNTKDKNVAKYQLKHKEDMDYNYQTLNTIFNEIVEIFNEYDEKYKDVFIEDIELIVSMFIWGDKNDDNFFDFMCETNFLEQLLQITQKLQNCREIRTIIIQQICLLILNVKKPMQLNYILSHQIINDLITFQFDFNDDDFVDYYINFLKSLSQRLDQIPLQLLFNSKYSNFPLIWQTIRFYNHKETMIRTSVQNIVLGVMKIKADQLEKYLQGFPFITFYVNNACFMASQWIQIDNQIHQADYSNYQKLSDLMSDQIDQILFWEDLIHSCNEQAKKISINSFISYALIPSIFNSFISTKKGKLSIYLSLHILTIILQHISNKEILEIIILTLFGEKINRKHLEWIQHPAQEPAHFNAQWSYRHFWDDYDDFLKKQTEIIFIDQIKRNQQIQNNSVGQMPSKQSDDKQPEQVSKSDVRSYFGWDSQGRLESEIRRLTRALGVKLVQTNEEMQIEDPQNQQNQQQFQEYLGESPYDIYYNTIRELGIQKQQEKDEMSIDDRKQAIAQNYEINPFRDLILSYLRSKDDNLIMLTLQFLNSIVQNKFICDEILEYCGLLTQRKNKINYKNPKNLDSLKSFQVNLMKILQIDPPFRLNNYFIISKLIYEFACVNHSHDILLTNDQICLFNDAYRLQILKMNALIKTQIVWDFIIDLYEVEFEYIEQNLLKQTKQLDYFCFLPLDNCPNSVDLLFRQPTTKRDITRRDLMLFFIVRKLRYILIANTGLKEIENNLDLSYKSFLNNELPHWEEGKFYEIQQSKMYSCELIEKDKKVKQLYYLKDQQNMILVEYNENNRNEVKVYKNERLKKVEAQIDRADPRKLELVIKNITYNGKEKYDDFILIFENIDTCSQIKKILDENRKTSKQIEMTVLVKFLESSEKDIFIPSIY
ncbi:CLEC16A, putative (macronuclear) [Tetrahymena thermophila SB210]|uniref:CLEC16A, putative n=1 Tax=Tetrahymena thermophila (strain SB210) TaxID=312017 RepID=Q22DR6_TETTS|nr:CLEC16A, putative [Tetrahymena thermophila SB210]EAR83388.3 CLEC16A, putative [Tetrahymena thermophila SB210]|eukprot:XP_001031051.3 CLEC16A, putative [Tetrahymena thermophila SB210]